MTSPLCLLGTRIPTLFNRSQSSIRIINSISLMASPLSRPPPTHTFHHLLPSYSSLSPTSTSTAQIHKLVPTLPKRDTLARFPMATLIKPAASASTCMVLSLAVIPRAHPATLPSQVTSSTLHKLRSKSQLRPSLLRPVQHLLTVIFFPSTLMPPSRIWPSSVSTSPSRMNPRSGGWMIFAWVGTTTPAPPACAGRPHTFTELLLDHIK